MRTKIIFPLLLFQVLACDLAKLDTQLKACVSEACENRLICNSNCHSDFTSKKCENFRWVKSDEIVKLQRQVSELFGGPLQTNEKDKE